MNTLDNLGVITQQIRTKLNSLESLLSHYVNIFKLPTVFDVDQLEYLAYDTLKVRFNEYTKHQVLVVKDKYFKCTSLESLNRNTNIHLKNYFIRNISPKLEEFYELPNCSIYLGNPLLIDLTKHSEYIYSSENADDNDDDDEEEEVDEEAEGEAKEEAEEEAKEEAEGEAKEEAEGETEEEPEGKTEEEPEGEDRQNLKKYLKTITSDEATFNTQMNKFLQNISLHDENKKVMETINELFNTEYLNYDDISSDFMLWIYMDDMDKSPVDIKIIPTHDAASKNELMCHMKNLIIRLEHEYNKMVILIPCSLYSPSKLRTADTHPNE
jgi:hypothetical protein